MSAFQGFPKQCLPFLKKLAANNERAWFNANMDKYEAYIREPALAFIADMGPELTKISPHFRAMAKKTGGSLMRVYRDTRFAKEKIPYKTNVGIQFRHELGKDVHAPGFYLHIEPGRCFVGAGIWHPEPKALAKIRDFIADNPHAWKAAQKYRPFKQNFRLGGDTLSRPPRGYAADHELIEDLKRKDFIAFADVDDKAINDKAFVKTAARAFKQTEPLMSYLCMALDVQY